MIEGEVGSGMEFTEQDETEYCENCGPVMTRIQCARETSRRIVDRTIQGSHEGLPL